MYRRLSELFIALFFEIDFGVVDEAFAFGVECQSSPGLPFLNFTRHPERNSMRFAETDFISFLFGADSDIILGRVGAACVVAQGSTMFVTFQGDRPNWMARCKCRVDY